MDGPVRSLLRDETADDDERVDRVMADYDLYLQPGEIRIPDPPVP